MPIAHTIIYLPTYAGSERGERVATAISISSAAAAARRENTRSRYNMVLHAGGGADGEAPPNAPDIAFACRVEGQPAIITAQEIDSVRKIAARNSRVSVYR